MSGFSNNGMAESWSEAVMPLLITAGNGGCRTYCANCDGAETSVAAGAGSAGSAAVDRGDDPESAGDTVVLLHAENMTIIQCCHHL